MHKLSYDMHIHSCLSPCGDEDMTPANIVNMAMLKELEVIAVTDHNSCKNCPPVLALAEECGILAIPGMELCTMEEVHVLCLFATLKAALDFDAYVYNKLIKIPNDERVFGKQELYNEEDRCIGTEPYLLINATEISFESLGGIMKQFHGIYIPAHIDKSSNGLISNLGFIPPDSSFRCAELRHIGRKEEYIKQHPYLRNCNIITNSDAHSLELINEPINFMYSEGKSREDILKSLFTSHEY
ncbi:MAG TPA: PHP domain-containing protein [Mobilitalea sp.]|nr:PHP domain-containing protein [Mobilitalea sp.]